MGLYTYISILYLSKGSSWLWSHGSWIYNYLCNHYQCLSPLTLWVRIQLKRGVVDTTLCDNVCQWLAAGQWFSPGTLVSSTNKMPRYNWNIVDSGIKHHKPTNQKSSEISLLHPFVSHTFLWLEHRLHFLLHMINFGFKNDCFCVYVVWS